MVGTLLACLNKTFVFYNITYLLYQLSMRRVQTSVLSGNFAPRNPSQGKYLLPKQLLCLLLLEIWKVQILRITSKYLFTLTASVTLYVALKTNMLIIPSKLPANSWHYWVLESLIPNRQMFNTKTCRWPKTSPSTPYSHSLQSVRKRIQSGFLEGTDTSFSFIIFKIINSCQIRTKCFVQADWTQAYALLKNSLKAIPKYKKNQKSFVIEERSTVEKIFNRVVNVLRDFKVRLRPQQHVRLRVRVHHLSVNVQNRLTRKCSRTDRTDHMIV